MCHLGYSEWNTNTQCLQFVSKMNNELKTKENIDLQDIIATWQNNNDNLT